MDFLENALKRIDDFVWGPAILVLFIFTGVFLTFRLRLYPWRRLFPSLKKLLSKDSRRTDGGTGDVSPFAALMTALAATIGTGNIVGVATAMVSGGAGALVWMWISAAFGITTKFAECTLSIKYREANSKGEMAGGPMYTMKNAFKNKTLGKVFGFLFALFTVLASFGIGNVAQANSISASLKTAFNIPTIVTGIVIAILVVCILVGGIQSISKVSSVLVPSMAVMYIVCGLVVVFGNVQNLPSGLSQIFSSAFSLKAVGGGVAGTCMSQAIRWGVARGVFSNEAGLGSAAISAAAAKTNHHVDQGYINMCGTFIDTIIVCTITGLAIACSGVLGATDETGALVTGSALTIMAFETVLGKVGSTLVAVGLALFAFSTIIGWEYNGEKALEYIAKNRTVCIVYRVVFSVMVLIGSTVELNLVWSFSDIANGLMAIPNLICLLVLSGDLVKDVKHYEACQTLTDDD